MVVEKLLVEEPGELVSELGELWLPKGGPAEDIMPGVKEGVELDGFEVASDDPCALFVNVLAGDELDAEVESVNSLVSETRISFL